MKEKTHLYLLWTNDNKITAEKMVFMYTVNSLVHGWWEKVTLIIWGATAKLAAEDTQIQRMIREAVEKGVHVTACKACTDQLEVTPIIESLGVEVKYWGVPLTDLLKNNETLLTV
ncbi:MAG: DsrE family protein [Proteobacteria bacterium]|nr:DsrE family protein [Desulfobacula sp.]MBU3951272.1 DsrE family protein [Pseudomonadota bacterium]MBU4129991.1 DsrE family protein [Pseudomonadota bacterium]